jgi:peptide/nickel transport system permease protein
MKFINKIFQNLIELTRYLFIPQRFNKSFENESIESPRKIIVKNFFANRFSIIGIIMFVFLFSLTFIGSEIVAFDPFYSNPLQRNLPPNLSYLRYPDQLVKEGVKDIQSGISFSIGLSEEGNLFAWGSDTKSVISSIPEEAKQANIVSISVGSSHAMAISDNNEFFFWGYNHMQQGQIATQFENAFSNDPIISLFGGIDMTSAVTQSGKAYIWGSGTENPGSPLLSSPYIMQDSTVVQSISLNYSNALLLSNEGTIRVLGQFNGLRLQIPSSISPTTPIEDRVKVNAAYLTLHNGLAVDENKNLVVWGSINDGMNDDSIPAEAKENIAQLAVGYSHAVVLSENGNVYAWGRNDLGQLDVPQFTKPVEKVFVSGYQNYALHDDGTLSAWGHRGFILGSDEMGRDFFSQIIQGGRITLTIGAIAVVISTLIGVTVGLVSGFFGGWVDNILMRLAEVVSSFPFLPLAITLSAFLLGSNVSQLNQMFMIMVILGVLSWTGLARLIRGQVLSEREKDYILASRALGIRYRNVIMKHILPSVFNIVIVNFTLGYAGSLLTEAGLSFLGFGVQKPNPSWGNILTAAQSETAVLEIYWWRWIIPGLCLLIAALSINLIGDALRDAMDPRANER